MNALTEILIDIARSQQVINYGITEIYQAINEHRERCEDGADAQSLPEGLLGPDDGAQDHRGST